eukprot:TRINITY_DN9906_c0_g1_i7.p1 TRINITY_DN9906_c0_g1~~TRINITY_DN9906_c0_g1_i7.p1  ORF type:complete len:327 (-),score=83.18 TRINITY_DN9906_c0_g1_i7:74-1054(-)
MCIRDRCKPSIGYTRTNAAAIEQRVGKLVRFGETVLVQCGVTPGEGGKSHTAAALSKLNFKSIKHSSNSSHSHRQMSHDKAGSRAREHHQPDPSTVSEPSLEDQKAISEKARSIAGVGLGDVVWAKYSSYPWWPGRITHAAQVSGSLKYKCLEKEGHIWTYNFGSHDFSQVRAVHVRHFGVGVPAPEPHLLKKHGIKDLYDKAVKEANQAAKKSPRRAAPPSELAAQDHKPDTSPGSPQPGPESNNSHNPVQEANNSILPEIPVPHAPPASQPHQQEPQPNQFCLLYTSDAADEEDSVDLGGRRIIKKKKKKREKKMYTHIKQETI